MGPQSKHSEGVVSLRPHTSLRSSWAEGSVAASAFFAFLSCGSHPCRRSNVTCAGMSLVLCKPSMCAAVLTARVACRRGSQAVHTHRTAHHSTYRAPATSQFVLLTSLPSCSSYRSPQTAGWHIHGGASNCTGGFPSVSVIIMRSFDSAAGKRLILQKGSPGCA